MNDAAEPGGGWWGQPRGLSTLFFTELWERFSYYGMRAILVLFMTNAATAGGLGMSDATATAIYGLYTAGVYLLALPGGWVADRLIGQRRAVFAGGVVIAAGHFTLAVPTLVTFYAGLILIVLGTGLLKPNISAIVGDLYPEGGARRDAGFSIYYMGINIGAFAGPLVCGYLGETINWHLGFGAAGVGMVAGLFQYARGGKFLGAAGLPNAEAQAPDRRASALRSFVFGLVTVAGIAALIAVTQAAGITRFSLVGFARGTGVFIVLLASTFLLSVVVFGNLTRVEKQRVFAIAAFFVASAVFWAGFEQAGSSMNLFAERLTDRVIVGWEMPASWLQSVNPIFIIALAPVFGSLWLWLGSRNPSIPVKFACGLVLLGVGFLVMAWGSTYTAGGGRVSPTWLIVTYFLHTTGELCLSPIGLSSITKLSPQRFVGQMMGIWFMGSALGNLIAGLIAGLIETRPMPELFGSVCLFTAGAGLLLLVVSPFVRRMIGDVR
jgi:proton-dependent oligopeptide transporter, POT family